MEYLIITLTILGLIFCVIRLLFGVYIGTREFKSLNIKKYYLFYWSNDRYNKVFLFETKIKE
jgi:hypothetical protein